MHSHAVRPLAEYNSVTWSPVAKHDIELVENVQRGFTERLCGLRNLSYCDSLTNASNAGSRTKVAETGGHIVSASSGRYRVLRCTLGRVRY